MPRPSVAEVVRYNHAELKEGDHNWMMRMINWNGCPLPVISFEGALGKKVSVVTGRTTVGAGQSECA